MIEETKTVDVYCPCCGVPRQHEVRIRAVPQHAQSTKTEVEIGSTNFDAALQEAEGLVKKINDHDFMLSPSIVSRSRGNDGMWRFVVRTYGLD